MSHQEIIESSWTFDTSWLLLKRTKKLLTNTPITLEKSLQMQIMGMARTTHVLLYHSEKMQVLSRPEFYAQAGNWSEIFTATPSSTSRLGHGQTCLLPACLSRWLLSFSPQHFPPLKYQQLLLDILWIYLSNQA